MFSIETAANKRRNFWNLGEYVHYLLAAKGRKFVKYLGTAEVPECRFTIWKVFFFRHALFLYSVGDFWELLLKKKNSYFILFHFILLIPSEV